jgi:hypothetical protein
LMWSQADIVNWKRTMHDFNRMKINEWIFEF